MDERDHERAVVDALRTHLEKWWGSCDELVWERGPMRLDCPEFRVLRAAREDDGLWLYASAGASALRQVEGTGHEYFVVAPEESPELVELVTIAAHYAVFGRHEGSPSPGSTSFSSACFTTNVTAASGRQRG